MCGVFWWWDNQRGLTVSGIGHVPGRSSGAGADARVSGNYGRPHASCGCIDKLGMRSRRRGDIADAVERLGYAMWIVVLCSDMGSDV